MIQYNTGLTSVSSSDDDIRDVSNSKSNNQLVHSNTVSKLQVLEEKQKRASILVKHGASPLIHKTKRNKLKI